MASNKRLLKAYARFDGSGRIVPGSTILRKKMPKVGRWKEVQTYLCCNGLELYYTPILPINYPEVRIYCDGSSISSASLPGTFSNLIDLANAFNQHSQTSVFGYYVAQSDGSIKLTVPKAVTDELCPGGVLTYTILPD